MEEKQKVEEYAVKAHEDHLTKSQAALEKLGKFDIKFQAQYHFMITKIVALIAMLETEEPDDYVFGFQEALGVAESSTAEIPVLLMNFASIEALQFLQSKFKTSDFQLLYRHTHIFEQWLQHADFSYGQISDEIHKKYEEHEKQGWPLTLQTLQLYFNCLK